MMHRDDGSNEILKPPDPDVESHASGLSLPPPVLPPEDVLEALIEGWQVQLGFPLHALADAKALVSPYFSVHASPLARRLMAADMALLLWCDDLMDRPGTLPPWLDALQISQHLPLPFQQLETLIFGPISPAHGPSEGALRWRSTLVQTLMTWHSARQLAASGEGYGSLVEYLEAGVHSSAIPHAVATLCELEPVPLACGWTSLAFQALLRALALHARLQNDALSVLKERREGCVANAVLVLEQWIPLPLAQQMIVQEMQGQVRLLEAAQARLPDELALHDLVNRMLHAHYAWYTHKTQRYKQGGEFGGDG